MSSFRLLQPAVGMEQDIPAPPQSRPLLTQKLKRTVTLGACIACRRRKSKCDGTRPTCTCCAQKDTECVYELAPHEKPAQAMKRKNEEMQGELSNLRNVQGELSNLRELYDFLRTKPEEEALGILQRIRESVPEMTPSERIQELADSVRYEENRSHSSHSTPGPSQHRSVTLPPIRTALNSISLDPSLFSTLPFPSVLTPGFQGPMNQRPRHTPDADVSTHSDFQSTLYPSIGALSQTPRSVEDVDPRLCSAVNWTKVTNDSELAAHLLSQWHRWEYKVYHFLDWELFVRDMARGQENLCSKLLVNALLSLASFQLSTVPDRSIPFADNIITLFYIEAQKLWDLETGHDSLPKIQAALVLYIVLGKNGRDKDGHTFLLEACRVGKNLGLFNDSSSISDAQRPQGLSEEEWSRSCAVTAWALFNFQLQMSSTYAFPPILESLPPHSIPYSDADEHEALFRSDCRRQIIMLEYVDLSNSDLPPDTAEELYTRLKLWWDERPTSLNATKYPTPENLLASMMYHASNVRLMQPFISRESPTPYSTRALSISSQSLQELRRLLILHEVCHEWTNAIPYVLHPIMVTGFGTLEELSSEHPAPLTLEIGQPYQGLLNCLRALSSISNFIYYAQPLFRLLSQTCQAMGFRLPNEIVNRADLYSSEQWTREAASRVSSQYVADIRHAAEDMENRRMDTVVAKWDALTISEKAKENVEGLYLDVKD